ncbi:hypothetical protein C8J57DRAFT_1462388 [Mycena rebaudengoi]|nr:hypothetical protein C8J57DRAFT_1462388 [Mycena rebaudengoi]
MSHGSSHQIELRAVWLAIATEGQTLEQMLIKQKQTHTSNKDSPQQNVPQRNVGAQWKLSRAEAGLSREPSRGNTTWGAGEGIVVKPIVQVNASVEGTHPSIGVRGKLGVPYVNKDANLHGEDFDLEILSFYDSGYEDGFAHGRIHGLIEGRALGREKGFEMWRSSHSTSASRSPGRRLYTSQGRQDDRAAHHIRHLLDLISQFPRVNPSTADSTSDIDILKLLLQIQSRYRALCSTVGVKPSNIRASESDTSPEPSGAVNSDLSRLQSRQSSAQPVWKIENPWPGNDFLK